MKLKLIKLHWLFTSQLGLDLLRFLRSLRGVPVYLRDWFLFRRGYTGKMKVMPCLHDRYEEGGTTKSEYFWQDLIVARWIYEAKPVRHVDVGSRVGGFVAHVASYRQIEVFDVRPITTVVPGVVFIQADLMNPATMLNTAEGYCDSLSCLHAIEHFGLGRYGDPINPKGYQRGISNMAQLLKSGGTFYLSVPIGQERVEFNANWVFNPRTIIRCANVNGLKLRALTTLSASGNPLKVSLNDETLDALAEDRYTLGIFVFTKING